MVSKVDPCVCLRVRVCVRVRLASPIHVTGNGSSSKGGGLMDQLGSIIGGGLPGGGIPDDSSGAAVPSIAIPGLSTGCKPAKAKPVVIEEMASAGGGEETSSGKEVPRYPFLFSALHIHRHPHRHTLRHPRLDARK